MVLNQEAQLLLHWAESMDLSLVPQFIVGAQNVVTDFLSHCHYVLGSEWTLARGCGQVGRAVAGDSRSFRHSPQLPAPGVFLSPLQSYGREHRCLSSGLGWTTGVWLPTFCTDLSGPEQANIAHGCRSHPHRSFLASEGVVPCAQESGDGSSGPPAHTSRPTQTAPLPSSAPEPPPVASPEPEFWGGLEPYLVCRWVDGGGQIELV